MVKRVTIIVALVIVGVIFGATAVLPKLKNGTTPQTAILGGLKKTYIAGEPIVFNFKANTQTETSLLLKSSYATLLLSAVKKGDTLTFTAPAFFYRKTGKVIWKLIAENTAIVTGAFEIIPQKQTAQIENYLGPRSMPVGDGHHTMMVAIPEDMYGNPMPDSTATTISNQFLDKIAYYDLPTQDFISWKRLYAPEKSGKMLTSVKCGAMETNETETDVYPAPPEAFTITFSRNHAFADGNQLTTLTTSVLQDKFGNIVTDGTMVYFKMTTKENIKLETFGATVNGIAAGKFLAPDHEDIYNVTAYVTGMAESNSINISYKPVPVDIPYIFNVRERSLKIGRVSSFMGQVVPEGTVVTVKLYDKQKQCGTFTGYTTNGVAAFNLPKKEYALKQYTVIISVLGKSVKTEIHLNE
ncbi:hypothetical protein [Flavobacterium rhizosphaerae]|uniref:Uncharacterized protein n=1 Tax=Flavobacterium rhizosphaerae TaxID=3163298 RepID=A0ABW8YXB3_9FLAO